MAQNQGVFHAARLLGKKVNHIYESHLVNGTWQTRVAVPFSSDSSVDLDPSLAPDGKRLFFISTRPRPQSDAVASDKKDMDIWYVDQQASSSSSINNHLPARKAGSEHYAMGTLFFRPSNQMRIRSPLKIMRPRDTACGGGGPPTVNSGVSSCSPYVAPNGKTLLFLLDPT